MMKNPLLLSIICALSFSWPVIAKASKVQPALITLIICITTAIGAMGWWYFKSKSDFVSPPIPIRGLTFVIVAGLLNSIGMVAYGFLVSSNLGVDVSIYVPITSALIILSTVLLSHFLLGEHITVQKIAGIAFLYGGIYLLQKS